jgi:hypothetical protein
MDLGPEKPNYAFVTSNAEQLQSLKQLEDRCNALASANGLEGVYIPWVSTSDTSMFDRFAELTARGWIRPDGKPFADRIEDVYAGKTFYPLRIAENGMDVGNVDTSVATGTHANGGAAGGTCNDFAPAGLNVLIGKADAGSVTWTDVGYVETCAVHRFYCFGIGRMNPVTVPGLASGEKRIFVTKNVYSSRPVPDADTICKNELALFNATGNFLAVVATTERSAADRFAAVQGPWRRMDGVIVTEDMTELQAPVELALDGTRVRDPVWFGAQSLTDKALLPASCNNWAVPASGVATTGQSERSGGKGPFDLNVSQCDVSTQHHYYCAEI